MVEGVGGKFGARFERVGLQGGRSGCEGYRSARLDVGSGRGGETCSVLGAIRRDGLLRLLIAVLIFAVGASGFFLLLATILFNQFQGGIVPCRVLEFLDRLGALFLLVL